MAQPLTDAINALTTYANSVTGASDTTLSDAVDTLVDGYGGGGGGGATGTYTDTAGTTSCTVSGIGLDSLSFFVMAWTQTGSGTASGWRTVIIIHDFVNNFTRNVMKGNANLWNTSDTGTFSFSDGTLSITNLNNAMQVGTYNWYAF